MASLERSCCPAVKRQLVMAYWNALLAAVVKRACDLEAQLFVQQQLHNAGGSIMQLLFGLPASEAVQVYAACSTTAGSAGGIGAGNKPLLAALGSSSSSSSSSVPGAVAGLDKVYHKGQEALALTMQTDRSLRVFYGFECAAVRDKLHDAVRLAVMGSNTALDRNLRCCEETVAALDLGLPHSERVIRVHPCFKYGTVRNKPGNLYLCSSMLAFDYDDSEAPKAIAVQQQLQGTAAGPGTALAGVTGRVHSSQLLPAAAAGDTGGSQTGDVLLSVGSRVLVRYADILKLKQEKGSWGDKHWLVVVYASGPRSEPCTLELGGGGQQLVSDMLADLSRIMAATGH
ncbi:hypothetical protein OEZ85_011498 [Tetradesmus obliquus]|uniref:Uncharacterized protein n=1 Tax=Tetradesmus obliquus TaxID=3088 RepID=A0ABY8TQI9_TETOB|nr:hypothetical protein OEZ85_011498 [Tetradesmus obliquus]